MLQNVSVNNSNICLCFLFFIFISNTCVYLFTYKHVHVWVHTPAYIKAQRDQQSSSIALPPYWMRQGVLIKPRAHQISPICLIWWASLLWEPLVSCLPRLELQAAYHGHLSPAWVPGYEHWSSCFLSKHFNHRAMRRPGICLSNNRVLQ